jgi:hypothetical protein
VDPRHFLRLAEQLTSDPDPAACRTVINRSYYAAYYVGVEVLERWGFVIEETARAHGQVRQHFDRSGDPRLQRVARQLRDLYSDRERADYSMADPTVEQPGTAKRALRTAERVISLLDEAASGPQAVQDRLREAIRLGIRPRTWE